MSASIPWPIDPTLDLVLQRDIDVPRELVWKAWTEPQHLMQWFCPRPWSVSDCEMDVRPGGIFRTTMRSPEGEDMPSDAGCFLEVVPLERLVWTDGLLPNYRVKPNGFFTAVLLLEPLGSGTRYTAIAMHKDPEGVKQHEEMGFHEGWGTALDQLVEYAKTLA
jgi:uncharacterized protein YndB with AHSA1/START domain